MKFWYDCRDTGEMMELLEGRISDQDLRDFAITCCRGIWDLLIDERSRNAVEVAEKFIDETATNIELKAAYDKAGGAVSDLEDAAEDTDSEYSQNEIRYQAALAALWVVMDQNYCSTLEAVCHVAYYARKSGGREQLILQEQFLEAFLSDPDDVESDSQAN